MRTHSLPKRRAAQFYYFPFIGAILGILGCVLAGAFALSTSLFAADNMAAGSPSTQNAAPNMTLVQMHTADVLNRVHHTNQKEIKAAHLALDKTQSAEVKTFAQRMIADHSSADMKVEALAKSKGVTLKPFQPADWEQAEMEQLENMNGSQFDFAYLDMMRSGHKMVYQELKLASASQKDPQVKSLLQSLMPTVHEHEQLAANYEKSQSAMAGQASTSMDRN